MGKNNGADSDKIKSSFERSSGFFSFLGNLFLAGGGIGVSCTQLIATPLSSSDVFIIPALLGMSFVLLGISLINFAGLILKAIGILDE